MCRDNGCNRIAAIGELLINCGIKGCCPPVDVADVDDTGITDDTEHLDGILIAHLLLLNIYVIVRYFFG